MIHHGAAVVTDQNSPLLSREFEHLRVGHAFEIAVGGGREIDGWFPSAHGLKNTVAEVGVSLETDQGRDSPDLSPGALKARPKGRVFLGHRNCFPLELAFGLRQEPVDLGLVIQIESYGAVDLRALQGRKIFLNGLR